MEIESEKQMTEHVKNEWYGNERKLSDGSYVDKNDNICYIKNGEFHREDGPAITQSDGTTIWCLNGKKHREYGPAVESTSGYKAWYEDGKLHKINGPAVIDYNGNEEWWIDGEKTTKEAAEEYKSIKSNHVKDWWFSNEQNLPDGSYIDKYCNVGYVKNKKLHREDGPAIEWANGNKEWHINGEKYSKEEFDKKVIDEKTSNGKHKKVEWNKKTVVPTLSDGSYIDSYNNVCYIKNGKLHRENGPAVECADGTKSWWVNDERHREDGPAVEFAGGSKEWFVDGKQYSYNEYKRMMARAGGATLLNWYEFDTRDLKDGCYMSHEGDICYIKNGHYYVPNGYAIVWADGRKEHKFSNGSYVGRFC